MGLVQGIQYNIKGLMLAFRTPRLLILGMMRFAFVLGLTFAFIGIVFYWYDDVLNLVWKMPEQGWLVYIWRVVSWLVFIGFSVISMLLAYIFAQLLFCVFIMDYMSRITESLVTGGKIEIPQGSYLSFCIYLMKQEFPRAIIPVVISFIVLLLSLLTPFSPIVIIVSSVTAALFLAWDNTDLVPARRLIPFKTRFRFLKKNLLFHIGFGLLFLIPWVNIVFLSFAPVGATLFVLDKESK